MSDDTRLQMQIREPEPTEHPDPRMHLTLRNMDRYLQIRRNRALTVWRFPVLYPQGFVKP